jgi:hypothetical protein
MADAAVIGDLADQPESVAVLGGPRRAASVTGSNRSRSYWQSTGRQTGTGVAQPHTTFRLAASPSRMNAAVRSNSSSDSPKVRHVATRVAAC